MKRIVIYIFLAIFICSCGRSYEESKRLSRAEKYALWRADSMAFKVAVMPTLDCFPFYLAKEMGWVDSMHVDFRLRTYTAQMDCDTALLGGSVQGAVSDLVRVQHMQKQGGRLYCLSSTGAYWQLISNRKARIKKLDQLGDKMVAMTRYSATDFLTDHFLKGVKTSSVVFKIQVNDVNVRLSMLLNNEMDAMWLTEPQATLAREARNNVVADSRDAKLNLGVIAMCDETRLDANRKEQLRKVVAAYNQACDSLNKNGIAHYWQVARKYYKLDNGTLGKLPHMKFAHIKAPVQSDINAVADWQK